MALLRLRVVWTGIPGTPYYSTHYATGDLANASSFVAAIADFWGALDGAIRNELTWLTESEVTEINPANGELTGVAGVVAASGTGNETSQALPPANQALLRLNTGTISEGRRIRGAIYIPGLTEAVCDDGVVLSSYRGEMEDAFDVWASSSSTPPAVWSRKTGLFYQAETSTAWEQFAVLRSRRD